MNGIGFDGGHSIYEFGPAPDVVLFFDCVKSMGSGFILNWTGTC